MAQGGNNWWRDGIFYQIYPRSFQDPTVTASAISPGISRGCLM